MNKIKKVWINNYLHVYVWNWTIIERVHCAHCTLFCSPVQQRTMRDREANPSRQAGQAEQGRLIRLQEVATHNICSGPERSVWTIIHDKVLANTHLLLSAHAESDGRHCRCTTSPGCWGSTRAARSHWWRRRPAGTPQKAMRWSCT